ncbi:MAG: acyl-CoA dehydrogenase [Acidimicrobiales bacterium]|nr:acyl-CoA dehydrogenase [Acidimicrobiales bacterium]
MKIIPHLEECTPPRGELDADSLSQIALAAILENDHPLKVDAFRWAAHNLADDTLIQRDLDCTFDEPGWQKMAASGLLGLLVEPELGGAGLDLCSALLTIEGLGHGCRDDGLTFALSSQVLTMQLTLDRFGSTEQRREWLPKLIAGEAKGAFCMTEPEAGSDSYSLTTTATPVGDGTYTITGEKAWVTMGPVADLFIVFATVSPDLGRWGISTFLVPASTPGLTVGPNRPKMGMRTTPFANVTFENCLVPESARLGNEGAGASIFSAAMEAERAFLLAGAVGNLERTIDDTISYAREREQFGQPIGAFQAVAHAIADMKVAHETARTLLYKAAALQQTGSPSMMAAAVAKLAVSENALDAARSAIEVHGARGYVSEFEIERDLRNTVGGVIYGGTSAIQRNIIGRLLGLPAGER